MKWPLHPIAPSAQMLVNALPVGNPYLPAGYAARLETVASGVSGHAAGVPVAPVEPLLPLPR